MEHGTERKGGPKTFKILVDTHPFELPQANVTGAHIKLVAGVNATYGLMLEGHGQAADQAINDDETVDLSLPGREHFYTVPPATFGGGV